MVWYNNLIGEKPNPHLMLGDLGYRDFPSVFNFFSIKGYQEVSLSNNVLFESGLCEALGGES